MNLATHTEQGCLPSADGRDANAGADAELIRLRAIADSSLYSAGVASDSQRYSFEILSRFLKGESILELGPAEGVMTERLAETGMILTVVEGSESFCESLSARLPEAQVIHSLFEEFDPSERFDNIVMGHVLEHVIDPVATLGSARAWLNPGGCLYAAVPNAMSTHRQAAVLMGLLESEYALNDLDRHHGHRRVFDPASFQRVFVDAGWNIDVFGGYWLKPLSNAQISADWTPGMIEAFMELGERYPDIAAEIYVVASLSRTGC